MQLTQPANNSKNASDHCCDQFFIDVLITYTNSKLLIFQIEINKNTIFGKYHIITCLVLMIIRHQLLKENKPTNFESLILLLSEVLQVW